MMRGNCGRRRLEGNSGLILRAGRSGWWIETELQNRFQGQCEMEFGILGSDDEFPGFSGWKRKWGMDEGPGICTLTIRICIMIVKVKRA